MQTTPYSTMRFGASVGADLHEAADVVAGLREDLAHDTPYRDQHQHVGAKGQLDVYGAARGDVIVGAHIETETVDEDLDARATSTKAGSAVFNVTRANLHSVAGASG